MTKKTVFMAILALFVLLFLSFLDDILVKEKPINEAYYYKKVLVTEKITNSNNSFQYKAELNPEETNYFFIWDYIS